MLNLGCSGAASAQAPAPATSAAAYAPVVGVRTGAVFGRLHLPDDARRMQGQIGGEAAAVISSNVHRRGGVQLEAAVNCLRFRDAAGAPAGASYRWIMAQPALIGFLRVMPQVQILGGAGLNLCLSCWRWPRQPLAGTNGFGSDYASRRESYPGGAFALAGLRGTLAPHWYIEGRCAMTTVGGIYRYKSTNEGRAYWSSVSIGYWLNPHPAPTAH